MDFLHQPVLLDECIEALNIKKDGVYLDGTLGGAGHSAEIAKRLENGTLIGVDRDKTALEAAKKKLEPLGKDVRLIWDNFKNLESILDGEGFLKIDGMLFDFGVSSPQLDQADRGFSYMMDAPLDMRMDMGQSLTAAEIVNTWPVDKLKKIIYEYGEERYAPAIARAIEKSRREKPIETTLELVYIIKKAMPASALREKQHPAKRTFQAIRIAVNDELTAISELMPIAAARLKPGGRLCVISFHSLEDRIVKRAMQTLAKGCVCPPDFPVCVCGKKPEVRLVYSKPVTAGEDEITKNPRARSAKLRIAEKL